MVDSQKVRSHTTEMAAHADRAAQFFDAFIGGRFVTREQACDMADFILAQTKRNIESCPFASQVEKDVDIRCKEDLINRLNLQMEQ